MLKRVLYMMIGLMITVMVIMPVLAEGEESVEGTGFPDFTLEDTEGNKISDEEAFGDADIILIDFFTYYCKPCKKMWPHLDALNEEYGDAGLKVVLFDEDDPEGIPLSRSYLKQKGYTFQVLFDSDGEIQSFYSVEKHPTTIILDADGNIIYKHEGYSKGDEDEFEEFIVDYLIDIGNLEE